jgi:hypothetical protein
MNIFLLCWDAGPLGYERSSTYEPKSVGNFISSPTEDEIEIIYELINQLN